MGKLGFFSFLMILKLLIFLAFLGFWGVVWKFWREALGLSWEFSVGCKDSSGLVGFDYDGLHLFTLFFCCVVLGSLFFVLFFGFFQFFGLLLSYFGFS